MNKQDIKIINVPISQLNPAPYNPRKWSQTAEQHLRESIECFGLVDPIIVNGAENRKDIVIGGHFRLKIAKDIGYTEIPAVFLNIPDVEKEKELNLRLNRDTGEWDLELLKQFDVNLLLDVGFDNSDLSHIWDANLGVEDDDFDVEKKLDEITTPTTKTGTIAKLGSHYLLCGDATQPETIQELVKAYGKDINPVSQIYCDPPYNIELDYNGGVSNKRHYGGKKTRDNKSDEEYKIFLTKTLQNGLFVTKPDAHVFYWSDERYIGLVQQIYKEQGLDNKRVCLWIKNSQNATPQIAFNKCYEPCVYATRGNPYLTPNINNLNEVMNKEVGTGNRLPDDILDLFSIWLVKRLHSSQYEHPTQKPPSLHEKALRRCTKIGDVVLDMFGGSGSTLIACEQLKRTCLLVEIEPIFCDLIIKRYQEFTKTEVEYVTR